MVTEAQPSCAPVFLTRPEAANFLSQRGLRIAATTLAKKAVTGGGPPYRIWNGRAIYGIDGLEAWANEARGTLVSHTAQRNLHSARLDARGDRQ
jgi:hypothetical protein